MNVFDLAAKLTLDKGDYDKGIEEAKQEGSSFGSSIKNAGKTIAKAGAAIAGVGGTLFAFANNAAGNADEIDKMSQKLGLSAKAYQEWDYVMQISGTDINSMSTGLKTLTNKFDDAKNGTASSIEMFEKLGLSMEDIKDLSREDLFSTVIYAFQDMEDSAERAALANDLFGRSGQELAPLFNTTADETKRLIGEVNDLGGIMSDDAVKDGAAFKDSLTALKTAFTGASNELAKELMPKITDFIKKITQFIKEGGLQKIIDNFKKLIPLLKAGAAAFLAFKTITTLVSIFKAVSTAITTVSTAQGILNGVMAANPFGAVALAVSGLVAAFTILWNTSEDFRGAIKLILEDIGGFFSDCFEGITAIFDDLPAFFEWCWEGIQNAFKSVGEWFSGIFSGAWEGIQTAWAGVTSWFKGIWDGIKNVFSGAWGSVKSWFGGVFLDAAEAITKAWDGIGDFFKGVWEGIQFTFQHVAEWFADKFRKAKEAIEENFNPFAIGEVIAEGAEGFKDAVFGMALDLVGGSSSSTTQPATVAVPEQTIQNTTNVYIGGEQIDGVVTTNEQSRNYRSGGRS